MSSKLLLLAGLVLGGAAEKGYPSNYAELKKAVLELEAKGQTSFVSNETFNAPAEGITFDCKILGPSPTVPSSVHQLRPGDIRVVGAVGDSVTASFGESSRSILDLFVEWRGRSWSIGHEFAVTRIATVTNILQEFNAGQRIIGGSTGNGGANSANARFNAAVSGAIAQNMPAQARSLVDKIKADPSVNFENDWKVVTLWIGGNDLCAVCRDRTNPIHTPAGYVGFIEQALDVFKTMPRTFVNLVSILEITQLNEVQSFGCLAGLACACGVSKDPEEIEFTKGISVEYMKLTQQLGDKAKWHDKDDFTVVVQPFFSETKIPRRTDGTPDKAYFAPDCFHFSELGHEAAAVALWNNMLEPVGQKEPKWTVGEQLKCPTAARPYLSTNKN